MIAINSKVKETVLDSGITIISEEVQGSQTFSLGLTAKAGTRNENSANNGIAHFMEHLAFRSSLRKSSKQIAMQFESVGAYTNAFTTHEYTCFYVRAMKKHFKKTANLIFEIVTKPNFKPDEVEKERSIIIEEIKSYLDDPEELISDISDSLLFADSSLGLPITGSVDSVKVISLDELKQFHKLYYQPSNLLVTFSGDIPHERIVNFVNNMDLESIVHKLPLTDNNVIINSGKEIIQESSFQQTHLLLSTAIHIDSSDIYYKLLVFNMLFGDGMSSRLYQNIRERYGLAYSVYSSLSFYSDYAAFYIYAATEAPNEVLMKKLIKKELQKILQNGVRESELNRAKEQLKTNIFMSAESLSNKMQSLLRSKIFDYETNDRSQKIQFIDNISKDNLNNFIAEYLPLEKINFVILQAEKD